MIELRTNRHLSELDTIASNLVWQDLHPEEPISEDEAMETDETEAEATQDPTTETSEMEVTYPY